MTDLTNITSISGPGNTPITLGGAFWDMSAVVGSGWAFFNPSWFGNQGATGRVDKLNRIQVGAETLASTDRTNGTPNRTTPSWVDSYALVMADAQVASTSDIGTTGGAFAARTSDFAPWGGASGGPGVMAIVGVNDSPSAVNCPLAVYQFQEASAVGGITTSQIDTHNDGPAVMPVVTGISGGSTYCLDLTAGTKRAPANYATGALFIGPGSFAKSKHAAGIVTAINALDPAQGSAGNGVAWMCGAKQSFQWKDAGGSVHAEIWGDAVGGLNSLGSVTIDATRAPLAGGVGAKGLFLAKGGPGIFTGVGAPSFSAPKGSLYSRADGSSPTTRLYINIDGGNGWANIPASQ